MTSYSDLWLMMNKYKSYFDQNLSSADLLCSICNGLLIDTYQGPCGCLYCKKCLKNLLETGSNYCPGFRKECKEEKLQIGINTHKDNNTNRKISFLQIKCLSNNCNYRNSLIDICEHLKTCINGNISCLYKDVGCESVFLINPDLTEHLQLDSHHHNKLIIDWMKLVKSDLTKSLKLIKDEISEKKLENIDQILDEKISQSLNNHLKDFEKNKAMSEEVQRTKFAKLYKETMNAIENQNAEISKLKNSALNDNFEMKLNSELEGIRNENKITTEQMCSEVWKDFSQVYNILYEEMKNFEQEISEKFKNRMMSLNTENIIETSQQCNENLNKISHFEWSILKFSEIKSQRKTIFSDYFYSFNGKYKMRLMLDPTISQDNSRMCILFYIDNAEECLESSWPFNASTKISIKNKFNPNSCQALTKVLNILKPTTILDVPKLFYFVNSDLERDGVYENDQIIIECCIFSIE